MSLRAIAAAAVVLSLIAGSTGRAQESAPAPAAPAAKGPPTARLVSGPDVGRRAPAVRLPWANKDGAGAPDQPYDLALDLGKTVVLAFYPRDFTSGCTAEMRTFAEQYDSLFGPDVTVLGVSTDSLTTHVRFATSLNLPFRLLSDPGQQVARRYAAGDESGYLRRVVYVIGPDGKVRYRNLRFNALDPKHYAELGAAVRRTRSG
ncbi:MAG TPA: peroxiredoxin [Gemmatimonadales bacterium]|jgi:peroxiredoxin Q/BCP|nr:peroxiredoxin [Gemmatimonadales bacterium]